MITECHLIATQTIQPDPVWRALRYEELPAVMQATEDAYRQMKAKAEARRGLDPSDMRDLRQLMSALTGDEQLVEDKVAQHYRIKVQACEQYERRNLSDVRVMEQVLLTGCNDDGSTVDRKVLDSTLKELLRDPATGSDDKLRLLVAYLLCSKSVEGKAWKEILAAAALKGRDADALAHLADLHIPLQSAAGEPRPEGAPFLDAETLARNKKAAQETVARNKRAGAGAGAGAGAEPEAARLMRYVTKVEDVLRKQIDGSLPVEGYPWVRAPPARGKGAADDEAAGAGAGAGADGRMKKLTSTEAMHGAHGEAVNKYVVSALSRAGEGAAAPAGGGKKGRFQSKFKGSGGAGGADGAGGGAGGSAAGAGIFGGVAEDGGDGEGARAAGALGRFSEPANRLRSYVGGRIFVFVVGGVTLSEVAAVERLAKKTGREIIVGGTSIMTAKDFIEQLSLTDPEVGDDAGAGGFGAGLGDLMKQGGVDEF
jgi:hypothetical protein